MENNDKNQKTDETRKSQTELKAEDAKRKRLKRQSLSEEAKAVIQAKDTARHKVVRNSRTEEQIEADNVRMRERQEQMRLSEEVTKS